MKVFVAVVILMIAMCGMPAGGVEEARVLCGRKLADAHVLYCFSPEDSETTQQQKRAIFGKAVAQPRPAHIQSAREWPWALQRAEALQFRAKRDTGLVDECCLKPCYLSELLSYC